MPSENPEADSREGYSIRVVARMTGISADQLRVWERRYGFPKPQRNASGIRLYSDEQVQRLSLVSHALSAGYRAKDAINASLEELKRVVLPVTPPLRRIPSHEGDVERLVTLLREDDVTALRQELRRVATACGPKQFVTEVASQLVVRVGDGWAKGELQVRHEHLLTEALSSQLHVLLANYEDHASMPSVVLATFPGEQHGIGLDMAALFLAIHGAKPRMLGVNTPAQQIAAAARAYAATAVGVSVSSSSDVKEARHHLGVLLQGLEPDVRVWIGGSQAAALEASDPRVEQVPDWPAFEAALGRLGKLGD